VSTAVHASMTAISSHGKVAPPNQPYDITREAARAG
jgi:hypothetical protein